MCSIFFFCVYIIAQKRSIKWRKNYINWVKILICKYVNDQCGTHTDMSETTTEIEKYLTYYDRWFFCYPILFVYFHFVCSVNSIFWNEFSLRLIFKSIAIIFHFFKKNLFVWNSYWKFLIAVHSIQCKFKYTIKISQQFLYEFSSFQSIIPWTKFKKKMSSFEFHHNETL